MNKKQNLLKALLNTIGQNKVCDSLAEINKAFDILLKAQRTDLLDKTEKMKKYPEADCPRSNPDNHLIENSAYNQALKDILKLTKGN